MTSTPKKGYNTSVIFEEVMIAPCGMNCGTCIAYMRPKASCPGCRKDGREKNMACVQCIIKNCVILRDTGQDFCYNCPKYPCRRLKQLEKRYRTKYRTSFLENLDIIKVSGISYFLEFETGRRVCNVCGATLSVHRNHCLNCLSLK